MSRSVRPSTQCKPKRKESQKGADGDGVRHSMTDRYPGPSPHSKEGRIHPPSMNTALGSLNPNVLTQEISNDKR